MKVLIVIPARYNSTRLPGKPLMQIAGRSMLERVLNKALSARCELNGRQELSHVQIDICIATDDQRIIDAASAMDLVQRHQVFVLMTDVDCASGSDRAYQAMQMLSARQQSSYDLILNLQGDAPFTPARYIAALVQCASDYPVAQDGSAPALFTPVIALDWGAYDDLLAKKQNPAVHKRFSGTSCVIDPKGRALWFSKAIIPMMRKEAALRASSPVSPVLRHVGLYAFRPWALAQFVQQGESHYEQLEGLEQLRALELGLWIQTISVSAEPLAMTGIDTQDDLAEAQRRLNAKGDDWIAL